MSNNPKVLCLTVLSTILITQLALPAQASAQAGYSGPVSEHTGNSVVVRLSRAVGLLRVTVRGPGGAGQRTCTAMIVSSQHILTNHHCMAAGPGQVVTAAKLVMGYLDDTLPHTRRSYGVNTSPAQSSRALDYAVVRVSGRPDLQYGTVTLSATHPVKGEPALMIHHPHGVPKNYTLGCSIVRTLGSIRYHNCVEAQGSSGAPVFSARTGKVVSLNFALTRDYRLGVSTSIASIAAHSKIVRGLSR